MSKETQLTRRPSESSAIEQASGPFDLAAMNAMADLIPKLKDFMDKNLEEGKNKDWEYSYLVFGKPKPNNPDDIKPMLLDPGVGKIMNFMRCYPEHEWVVETDMKTNNMTIRMKVNVTPWLPVMYQNPLTNKMEPIKITIAQGVGSVTTREKKYRVRHEWMKHRDLLVDGWTKDDLQDWAEKHPEQFKASDDPKYDSLYFMPTAESLGLDNNVFKIAAKRAEMDAVFQLPGVASRYSQEIDLKEDRGEEKPTPTPPPAGTPKPAPPPPGAKQEPQPQGEILTPPSTAKPSLKSVDLGDPVEQTIAAIQAVNKGLSRAQIVAKIGEEKAKAAGLLTDEAAAYLVRDSLIPSPGFKSASELPKVPEGFRPSEEAGYAIDFIVENYGQQLETVRALVYRAMNEAEPHLTDVEAVKVVREDFERRSKPPEGPTAEDVEKALAKEKLDSMRLTISADASKIQPKRFLGDDFTRFNDALRPLGYEWIRADKDSRWERRG